MIESETEALAQRLGILDGNKNMSDRFAEVGLMRASRGKQLTAYKHLIDYLIELEEVGKLPDLLTTEEFDSLAKLVCKWYP